MASNNVLKNSNALGQSKEDIIYFKVVSNTDDFDNNEEKDFKVNPYGGIDFDKRFQWNASAISASIPFDSDLSIANSIWYKRINCNNDQFSILTTPWAYGGVYWRLEETLKQRFPTELARKTLLGKDGKKKLPSEFRDWFSASYNNRISMLPNGKGQCIYRIINPILRLVDYPGSTEVDDAFEFDFKRIEARPWSVNVYPSNELIRMSRTLEVLLGLNANVMTENNGSWPVFTEPLPGMGVKKFSADFFWNPPYAKLAAITQTSITSSNFWKELLKHYHIPCVFIKINQSYKDDDPFQPGPSVNSQPNFNFSNYGEEYPRNEQFSDYFISLNLFHVGMNQSVRDKYYGTAKYFNIHNIPPLSRSPCMIGLKRGISWGISKYIRWPIGSSLNTTCDFTEDNIYSGSKEKSILHCEIPIGIKTQFPFAKFPVKIKTPLTNQMSLYNNITLSFKTSRRKRTHLKLKQNKKYLRRLNKKQVHFKTYKYPLNLTLKASALY